MTLPLSSESLLRAAAVLRADAAHLSDEHAWHRRETQDFAAAGRGDAFVSLTGRLRGLEPGLNERHRQMLAVAHVLEAHGSLADLLERAVARVEPYVDRSWVAHRVMKGFSALGTALDVICAREITRICTPTLPEPKHRMADLPELDPDELHELNLLEAPEPVRRLAERHPDLRLLSTIEGGLVAAVGDLATADTVTTFVAGVGSADVSGWSTQVDRTRDLAAAAGSGSSRNTAGIVWLGYHAPPSVPHGLQRTPAEVAGRELAGFQRELARRYPGQRRVVAGFSYGGVVVGQAARQGLHADDVVFIASPGVGAASVDELTLHGRDPQVHALVSPGDPIGLITGPYGGVHGPDPAEPEFGARVVAPRVTGGHSSYFEDSAFLDAFGEALQDSAR